jgi:transposase-like protein
MGDARPIRIFATEPPKTLEPAKRQLVVKLYTEKQHTIVEICRMMGISKPTLYNYLAEAGL